MAVFIEESSGFIPFVALADVSVTEWRASMTYSMKPPALVALADVSVTEWRVNCINASKYPVPVALADVSVTEWRVFPFRS